MSWGTGLAYQAVGDYGEDKTTGVASVELQPTGAAYPSGVVAMVQGSENLSRWVLTADSLTDDEHYILYVNGSDANLPPIICPNSRPAIG